MVVFSGTVQSDFLKNIPSELDNKQALINFASSDFESIRSTLLRYIKANFPLDYNNFQSSDFGILLVELMAAVGHIQSNKSDYLANENFIGTARSRDSIKRLLELIGVRMKGPIGSAANASVTMSVPTSEDTAIIRSSNRTISITSPEDNAPLTFTLYKVNSNGTVDLTSPTEDLELSISGTPGTVSLNNLVFLEGSLVVERGTFNTPNVINTLNLSEFPYIEKSAQVFIEGATATAGVYEEEDNIYFASGPSDKVFQVATDERFKASISFGDDTLGVSPSIGDTYVVTYRVGGGSRGNLDSGVINSPITVECPIGTEIQGIVENTSMATGGRDAETIQQAKRYAPTVFRSQNRLVTLEDYKGHANSFASNYGSTGKATASVRRAFSSANMIDLFVLERASDTQLRRATTEYKKQLLESIQKKKMLTDEVVVVDGLIRTLDLFVTITLDENMRREEANLLARTRNSIQNYMNMDNTDFSEPFVPQDLIRTVLGDVTDVRYATVDNVNSAIRVGFNEVIQLNNLTIQVDYV
jgi:hypothetical protein